VILAVFSLLFSIGGCLFKQRREMMESRDVYQKCVKANPANHKEKCAELEAEA
jgi:hypothetical protein